MVRQSLSFRKNVRLQANLKRLETIQPRLVRRLRAYMNGRSGLDYTDEETPSGRRLSGLAGRPFFEPARDAWSAEIRHEGYPIVYLLGRGSRRYFKEVLEAAPPQTKYYVIVETAFEPVIDTLCALDFTGPFFEEKAILFLVDGDGEGSLGDLEAFVSVRGAYIATLANFVIHRGEIELFGEALRENLDALMKKALFRVRMLGNAAEDTMWGFRQMALNLPWMVEGAKLQALRGRFRGFPAVVVAAGPSLDKNVHLLAGLQDRVLIVAVETVLKKLLALGIRPHFVVALERDFVVYEKHIAPAVEAYEEELRRVVLVSQSVCVSLVAGRWPGPVALVGKEGLAVDKIFLGGVFNVPAVESGASAANMALGVAALTGASPVALIGQDLAFAADGHSHASGTAWEKGGGVPEGMERYPVRGWHGDTVYTHWAWDYFKDCFNDIIGRLSLDVYDCTEGGADIEKARNLPFADWIAKHVSPREPLTSRLLADLEEGSVDGRPPLNVVRERLSFFRDRFVDSRRAVGTGLEALERVLPGRPKEENLPPAEAVAEALEKATGANPLLQLTMQGAEALLRSQWHVVRDMERADDLEEWRRAHGEFLRSMEIVADFHLHWLDVMLACVDAMASSALAEGGNIGPLPPERAFPAMEALLDGLAEEPSAESHLRLDNLYARCGKLASSWPPERFRRFARHFMDSGRYIEAQSLLTVAVRSMEGTAVDRSEAFVTLTSWALALSCQDLNQEPSPRQAYRALKDARNYGGSADLADLLRRVLQVRLAQLETSRENSRYDGSHPLMEELARWIASLKEALEAVGDLSVVDVLLASDDRPIGSLAERVDRAFGEKTLKIVPEGDDTAKEGRDAVTEPSV